MLFGYFHYSQSTIIILILLLIYNNDTESNIPQISLDITSPKRSAIVIVDGIINYLIRPFHYDDFDSQLLAAAVVADVHLFGYYRHSMSLRPTTIVFTIIILIRVIFVIALIIISMIAIIIFIIMI